jgi:hypothetical protein
VRGLGGRNEIHVHCGAAAPAFARHEHALPGARFVYWFWSRGLPSCTAIAFNRLSTAASKASLSPSSGKM